MVKRRKIQRFEDHLCPRPQGTEVAVFQVQATLRLTVVSQSVLVSSPIGTHDQILSRGSDRYSVSTCGVLSDERAGLSFVICLCLCHVYAYVHLHCLCTITIYILLCTIYTWPLSVQALCSKSCLTLSCSMLQRQLSHLNGRRLDRRQV
jgi:hypothetical protein